MSSELIYEIARYAVDTDAEVLIERAQVLAETGYCAAVSKADPKPYVNRQICRRSSPLSRCSTKFVPI